MNNELSPEEATKLFNEVSQAVHASDSVKLSEVMNKQPPEKGEPVQDLPVADKVQPDETEDKDEKDPPEKDEAGQEGTTEEESKEPEKKDEPNELDKLKAQLAKLTEDNHKLRSNAGRIPQIQRRIQELDKKLEERAKSTSPSSQTSTKIKPKVDELLESVRTTDPELAKTIAAVIDQAISGVDEAAHTKEIDTLKLLREDALSSYQEEQTTRLLTMYPNAADVFQSPAWTKWKTSQTNAVRSLAESSEADDVAFAFEKYATDMRALYPELDKQKGEVKASVTDPEEAERAKKLEAERQRKKETAANVGTPNAAGKVGLPDDPQALFDKYAADIRKQRTG